MLIYNFLLICQKPFSELVEVRIPSFANRSFSEAWLQIPNSRFKLAPY